MSDRDSLSVVGKPRRRVDGRAKVTGQTLFADDLVLPRMLHCKLLRSPVAHALIKRLDVSAALDYPGVHHVLTGKDLPIEFGILPVSQDEEALCGEKVRFVGDPVAAVIADDELVAMEAIEHIDVEFEPLETIDSPESALRTPAPRITSMARKGTFINVSRWSSATSKRRSTRRITSSRTRSTSRAIPTSRSSNTPRLQPSTEMEN